MKCPCLRTSYGRSLDDVKERTRRGQRQHYCFETGLWEWSDFACECSPKLTTERELATYTKRLAGATVGLSTRINAAIEREKEKP